LCVADCGTVVNPRGLEGQLHGGAIQGIGYARSQKWVYDPEYGVPLAKRFHHNRPPTILDIPENMDWDAVNLPDPQTPVGAKGMAEAAVGAGAAAIRCALAGALGDDFLRRTPVGIDMILSSLEAKKRVDQGLTSNV
jgi:CO/xanthine dehydrogenase Mo-binding subunit